jgi:hypothetical protein
MNKLIQFSRLVKINGRLHEINYKKNNIAGSYVFDVDTADDRGNRIFFRLIKDQNEWDLTASQKLPDWISENKLQLATELEEGIQNF